MTKKDLEQLKSLKLEAKHLQEEIRDLPTGDTYVADTIKDYSENAKGSIQIIQGYGMSNKQYAKRQQLAKKLARKLAEIQDLITDMEDWLDNIPDSEMRDILRLTYRNGLTREKVAAELGCDECTVRRKIKRFFQNAL